MSYQLGTLDNNRIDNRGESELVHHVPSLFPSLGEDKGNIFLNGNTVSRDMEEKLKQKLDSLHW